MRKPKWVRVVEHLKVSNNVTKTASKFKIDRSTVYSYKNRAKKKGLI